MTDDIDRIVRARVVADGLPLTPGKNPWRCRAVSGLALVLAYGADGEIDYVGVGGVPVVSAVSYPVVSTAGGGSRVVVTVDDSTGATAASAGGVAFTSFAIDDATHVSGVPGAHVAGVVDVVVTNAAGPSTTGTGLIEYWAPGEETLSVLLMPGDYSESMGTGTWVDSSGNARDATLAGFAPVAVSGCPSFDAASFNQLQVLETFEGTVTDLDNGEIIVIGTPTAIPVDTAGVYTNPSFCSSENASPGLAVTDGGVKAYGYSTAYDEAASPVVPTINVPAAFFSGWDATGLEAQLNAGTPGTFPWTSGAGLGAGYQGTIVTIGKGYSAYADVDMKLFAISPVKLTGAKRTKFYQWSRQRGYIA